MGLRVEMVSQEIRGEERRGEWRDLSRYLLDAVFISGKVMYMGSTVREARFV